MMALSKQNHADFLKKIGMHPPAGGSFRSTGYSNSQPLSAYQLQDHFDNLPGVFALSVLALSRIDAFAEFRFR